MTRSHFTFWGLEALLLGAAVLGLATCVPCATAADKPTVKNGTDDGLGYTAAFDAELKKLGPITPKEFADRYTSKAKYIDKLTWDPTTAKFYDLFNKDPRQANPNLPRGVLNDDFRLNEAELAAFKKNGFVVSERMGTASFAEMYYRIFSRDLPVYVSADAVLHAWHRTYDSMLMEVELAALAPALARVLEGMAEAVPAVNKDYGKGVLADGVSDADYFLAVARSLLAGRQITSHLGQDNRVAETLKACDSLQLMEFKLFGRRSQDRLLTIQAASGHYERSEDLQRYFRAMDVVQAVSTCVLPATPTRLRRARWPGASRSRRPAQGLLHQVRHLGAVRQGAANLRRPHRFDDFFGSALSTAPWPRPKSSRRPTSRISTPCPQSRRKSSTAPSWPTSTFAATFAGLAVRQ